MKNIFLTVVFTVIIATSAFAQSESGFGLKGGVNYNANGSYFDAINNTSKDPTATVGYHIGIFGKLGNKLYFRPELVYTSTKSDYDTAGDFSMQKLDAPLLVGIKVIGPVHVFAGPSLQYILESDLSNAVIDKLENDFSVGLHFGIGLNINQLGLDLRYERGFNNNEATVITNNTTIAADRLDTRPEQLILSLSYKL